MNKSVTYDLSIGGFTIRLHFYPTEIPHLRTNFIKTVINHFGSFIVDLEKERDNDYSIYFMDRRGMEIISRNKVRKYFLNFYDEISKNKIISFYHISLYQLEVLLKKILSHLLSKNNGFIFHASANYIYGKAVLFTGRSGAGKSTAMNLLSDKYQALADDNAIIRKEGNQFYFYQIPLPEKINIKEKSSKKYLLGKIFFLRKKNYFRIEKISDKNYLLKRLFKQFWTESQYSRQQIKTVVKFVNYFEDFYFLNFAKNKGALDKLFMMI